MAAGDRKHLVQALECIARIPCEDTATCLEKIGAIEELISYDHSLDNIRMMNMRLALKDRAEALRPPEGRSNKAGARRL